MDMPKTPDEIKNGVECCLDGFCSMKCPNYHDLYPDCIAELKKALFTYIQRLEAERDALIEQARENDICVLCKHEDVPCDAEPCVSCCAGGFRFEWRGVQKEE